MNPWQRVQRRGLNHWLPTYVAEAPSRRTARAARRGRTTHLMFLVCDHFEPRHGVRDETQIDARLQAWGDGFGRLQQWCAAEFGTRPLHTWFYPPHHGDRAFSYLPGWVYEGLGEAELHYHHHGDTEATFRAALRTCLDTYARHGLLLESGERPSTRFGFVHGDWALDNSCHGRFCGVNGELSILAEHGCWGDFTMPSSNECQTRKINSIYYAIDSRERSKSHDWGRDARVGQADPPGFWLMQGPIGLRWDRSWRPRIENASLTTLNWGSPDRIESWIDCNVHVHGRPEWLFIKLHTHGAIERDFDALFGERARTMHRLLNTRYNDGQRYKLHYVTARQAYNIAKAAEHGLHGDPQKYLDYRIQPPALRLYQVSAQHELLCCTHNRLHLRTVDSGCDVQAQMRVGPISMVGGAWSELVADSEARTLRLLDTRRGGGARLVRLRPAAGCAFDTGIPVQSDGTAELRPEPGQGLLVQADTDGRLQIRQLSIGQNADGST